jgi:hypothetical protein
MVFVQSCFPVKSKINPSVIIALLTIENMFQMETCKIEDKRTLKLIMLFK